MMKNTDNRLQYLFQQYLANHISEEEYAELWKRLQLGSEKNMLSEEFQVLWEKVAKEKSVIPADQWNKKIQQWIQEAETSSEYREITPRTLVWKSYKWRIAAAAAILLLIIGGFHNHHKQQSLKKATVAYHLQQKDILPGGNKAVLILSNGAAIILDSATNGTITQQGNSRVSKSGVGKIIYHLVNTNPAEIVYNTLRTPRGGQYQLTLPDGSKVWLDAASSIRFPTSFAADKRAVEITGEAYFEIVQNAAQPFVVSVNDTKIKVLGTHFNVNAYDDEPTIKVTLLEGSVVVGQPATGHSQLLIPGQQAQIDKESKITLVKQVDLNEAVAWKNNLFWFEDNNIQTVMRQIARWYNVDVDIIGQIPQHFTGSIPRNVKVSRVFEVLQETGRIHFKIGNKKIIITP